MPHRALYRLSICFLFAIYPSLAIHLPSIHLSPLHLHPIHLHPLHSPIHLPCTRSPRAPSLLIPIAFLISSAISSSSLSAFHGNDDLLLVTLFDHVKSFVIAELFGEKISMGKTFTECLSRGTAQRVDRRLQLVCWPNSVCPDGSAGNPATRVKRPELEPSCSWATLPKLYQILCAKKILFKENSVQRKNSFRNPNPLNCSMISNWIFQPFRSLFDWPEFKPFESSIRLKRRLFEGDFPSFRQMTTKSSTSSN